MDPVGGADNRREMTLVESQQRLALERLRGAGEETVSLAVLRAAGVDFPAAVISELELMGYPIERVRERGRLVGVRLVEPPDPGTVGHRRWWSRSPRSPGTPFRRPLRGPASYAARLAPELAELATGETLGACLEPGSSTCLTYAYALYDLGRATRLSGEPQAAVPIPERRLQIDNQRSIVGAELQLARERDRLKRVRRGRPFALPHVVLPAPGVLKLPARTHVSHCPGASISVPRARRTCRADVHGDGAAVRGSLGRRSSPKGRTTPRYRRRRP